MLSTIIDVARTILRLSQLLNLVTLTEDDNLNTEVCIQNGAGAGVEDDNLYTEVCIQHGAGAGVGAGAGAANQKSNFQVSSLVNLSIAGTDVRVSHWNVPS